MQLTVLPSNAKKWEEVTVKFLDGHNVFISAGDKKEKVNYKDMGFQNDRTLMPNKQWHFLELLSLHNGVITWDDPAAISTIKKTKQLLGDTLKEYFQLQNDPFYPYDFKEHAYKIKINLIPQ